MLIPYVKIFGDNIEEKFPLVNRRLLFVGI